MAKVSQEEIEAAIGNGLDAPEAKASDKKDEVKDDKNPDDTDDPDDDDDNADDKKDEKKDDSKKDDDKADDKKDTADDKKDEKKSDDKKDEKQDKKNDNKTDDEPVIEDDLIAKVLEEKYDISNFKDLVETLEGFDELMDRHEKLVEENKQLKEKPDLKFESDSQKKVYEFLTKTGYDPENIGDGIMTHAKLVSMDLGKDADPKMILEERFVIEHPELSRAEAQKKFNRDYERKYVVDKTKFETPEELKEEQEFADIEKKSAVAKAVEFLKKKQEEFKPEAKSSKKDADETKVTKEVEDGLKKTVANFRGYMEGLETLTFSDEKNPDNTFTYQVPKKIQKQVLEAGTKWLSRPDLYNEKGEISSIQNIEDYTHNVIMSQVWKDLTEKMLRHVEQKAKIVNVEKKSEKTPERKGGSEKGGLEGMDFMQQAEIDATNRVKERKRQGR